MSFRPWAMRLFAGIRARDGAVIRGDAVRVQLGQATSEPLSLMDCQARKSPQSSQ
jgi:hypothetical protein